MAWLLLSALGTECGGSDVWVFQSQVIRSLETSGCAPENTFLDLKKSYYSEAAMLRSPSQGEEIVGRETGRPRTPSVSYEWRSRLRNGPCSISWHHKIRDKLPSGALPELWAKQNVSFKPLSFGVVCYTPVDSQNILSHLRASPASLPFLILFPGPRTPSSFPSTSIFFGIYQDKLLLFPKGFSDYSSLLWHVWPKPSYCRTLCLVLCAYVFFIVMS